MFSRLIFVLLLFVLVLGGGCLETMHLNVANGMLEWDFTSRAATSYRIGSFETSKGTAMDLLYFDAEVACPVPDDCCGVACLPPPINPEPEVCE